MPSLSASQNSTACPSVHARLSRPLAAAAYLIGLCALGAAGCRDTREDPNFCTSCASDESSTGAQEELPPEDPSSEPMTTTPPDSSAGSMTSSSTQAGSRAQTASADAASGGSSAAGSSSAGTSGARAGAAARGGSGAADRDAGLDNGSSNPRDAGSQQPMEPEFPRDAGPMTPAMPCNGPCPNDRPVCDETKPVPQCVQCTADQQFACIGETPTCDVEQQKCVECTPQDARNCRNGNKRTCNKDNRCVACTAELPGSCPPAQPVCDNEERCVECLPDRPEHCTGERSVCNGDRCVECIPGRPEHCAGKGERSICDGDRCVECMSDTDCGDLAKPRCDLQTNSCLPCEGNNDCARFPGANVCENERKACVGCSPTGELCPVGQFCDRNTFQCQRADPKKPACERCENDPECADSESIAACIVSPQDDNYKFCSRATDATAPRCPNGYMPTSVPGRSAKLLYCTPIGTLSCPAIQSALNSLPCMSESDCGRAGKCPSPMPPDNICSLSCTDTKGCPDPLRCDPNLQRCVR